MNEPFFVGILEPVEVRKELLTSSRQLVNSLRKYEDYKHSRDEKLRYIIDLKRVFDELLVLNRKLRSRLPRTIGSPHISSRQKTHSKPAQKTTPSAKADLLERELSRIEERLGSIEKS